MGVDTTSVLNPNGPGRKSVRIQSKRAYNQALVIADFAHVPGSNCGSWPALYVLISSFDRSLTEMMQLDGWP